MKNNILLSVLFVATVLIIFGCEKSPVEKGSPEYISEINDWHKRRIENLKKESGWLNLIGLFILKEGENTFGSSEENDFILESEIPKKLCTFILEDSVVKFKSELEVKIYSNGNQIDSMILQHDLTGKPTILEYGTLKFFIIKRGKKFALRVRDLNAPLLKQFEGIERFPVNDDWKINADFITYDPPKIMRISNVIGTVETEISTGKVSFSMEGKTHTIDAIDAGSDLFILFADETSGKETYGAGRFLYCSRPDSNGKVILDFNKAYNPPCVFTPYATCPLPPPQNHLKLAVTAGEKNYGDH
ncbi:MAG: DUF1684 domain-containing protein [Bacteroidetes bacterium]|nr:DUF1684 domain-containing protein [Bacteroidota bacterium]